MTDRGGGRQRDNNKGSQRDMDRGRERDIWADRGLWKKQKEGMSSGRREGRGEG